MTRVATRGGRVRRALPSIGSLAALGLLVASPAWGLTPGQERLNGFWNVDDAGRTAAIAGVRAELTDAGKAVQKRNADAQAEMRARGQVLSYRTYTCAMNGVPAIFGTSEPWLLVVKDHEAMQFTERRNYPPRHFYLDGRRWPDMSKMPPSPQGFSIAHWEGDDLVIETRGMPDGNVQGGGLKGQNTLLTERVHLSADGDSLTWTYTWTDPVLLAKPLTYSVPFTREKEPIYAYTHDCDPNEDPAALAAAPEQ